MVIGLERCSQWIMEAYPLEITPETVSVHCRQSSSGCSKSARTGHKKFLLSSNIPALNAQDENPSSRNTRK
jgi:hypothetical protein